MKKVIGIDEAIKKERTKVYTRLLRKLGVDLKEDPGSLTTLMALAPGDRMDQATINLLHGLVKDKVCVAYVSLWNRSGRQFLMFSLFGLNEKLVYNWYRYDWEILDFI